MSGLLQAFAFALLVAFAVIGANEVDRRLAGCERDRPNAPRVPGYTERMDGREVQPGGWVCNF